MLLFSYIISPLANIIPFRKLWTITNYELRIRPPLAPPTGCVKIKNC